MKSIASSVELEPAPAITGAPLGGLDAQLDDLLVLLVAQRRAFARGADRHQAVGAFSDLPFDQTLECAVIDFAALEGVISAVNEPLNMGCSRAWGPAANSAAAAMSP